MMFKSRLFWAFSVLAIASVVQGVLGSAILRVVDQNIQRGRVANDLLVGFVDLSANKRRLRVLLYEELLGGPGTRAEINQIQNNMMQNLDHLETLAQRAAALYKNNREMEAELAARARAIEVLRKAVKTLDGNVTLLLDEQAVRVFDWRQINQVFDLSDGLDLRALLAESISREKLATARDRAAANASLELLYVIAISASLTLSLIAVGLALYFSKALSKPLRHISTGARELESGNLDYRIPENANDEFSELARAVNRMSRELSRFRGQEIQAREELERLVTQRTHEVQEALHRLEKIDLRRRQMFADISHELKTPTTAIRGEAEIALRGKDKDIEGYKDTLDRIRDSAKHLTLVIEDMLTLARSDIDSLTLDRTPVRLETILIESIKQVNPMLHKKRMQLQTSFNTQAMVLGDRQRLMQVFVIVLDNAVQYSPEGSTVFVRCSELLDDESMRVAEVEIEDQGMGIAHDVLPRVWERHFRSDDAKLIRPDGSGLGLPLASALVRAHFGTIELKSSLDEGTTARIVLPIFESTLPAEV